MYLYFILFMLFFKVLGVGGLLRAETVIKPSRDAGSSDGSLFACKPCCCAQPRAQQLPFFLRSSTLFMGIQLSGLITSPDCSSPY